VAVIVPRQSRQVPATITDAGTEQITIGGQNTEARRIRVEPQGLPLRIVWVDSEHRILRLSIPDEDYLAERARLP
jgi:hypothetical protein